MGVEQRRVVAGEVVVELLASLGREPVAGAGAGLAIDPIMRHHGGGVDTPTFTVERISLRFGQTAWDDRSADHGSPSRLVSSITARQRTATSSVSTFLRRREYHMR